MLDFFVPRNSTTRGLTPCCQARIQYPLELCCNFFRNLGLLYDVYDDWYRRQSTDDGQCKSGTAGCATLSNNYANTTTAGATDYTAYLGTGLETPTRKPRGGALTAGQKAANRRVARRRVVAEHGIGKMKVWRVAAERYRNPVGRHTLIMKNVAGLHNLMFA